MEKLKTKSVVLKIWQEKLTDDSFGLRGEMRNPAERNTRYFTDWSELKAILEETVGMTNNVNKILK